MSTDSMDSSVDSSDIVLPIAALSALLLSASVLLLYLRHRKSSDHVRKEEVGDEDARPVIHVCFGTQTGTAEKFAKQLVTKLNDLYGVEVRFDVLDMEHYEPETAFKSAKMLFFMMATYGDGEPTDNAQTFHEWLTKTSDDVMNGDQPEPIKDVPFAVFGLGNRQYEHFNAVGKHTFKHLEILGGSPLVPLGLGDDDDDIADDFDKWLTALLAAIDSQRLLAKQESSGAAKLLQGYEVETATAGAVNGSAVEPWAGMTPAGSHTAKLARVQEVRELHGPASERSCVHVEVDLSGTGMTYEHGDHVAVHAQNSPETVALACEVLGLDPDSFITLKLPPGNPEMLLEPPAAGSMSVRNLLTHHYELLQRPDKAALAALATTSSSATDAAFLQRLASHEGKAEYAAYVVHNKRSLIEVLQEFPSCKPSPSVFFAHIASRLLPRYYSISSSPLAHPSAVHITAAVINEVVPSGRRHKGVATHTLAHASVGTRLPVYIRNAPHFKLPPSAQTPLIMIGPGTGLAPFRGFLQHRESLKRCNEELGPAMLYFGCRHPDHDYLYQAELERYLEAGVITHLSTAFSRVHSHKDYVQHHLLNDAAQVHISLEAGAHLYVCGDAMNMARDVHRALHQVVQKQKQCSGNEAEAYIHKLQKEGRYVQDVW